MTDDTRDKKIEVCIYFKVNSYEVTRRIKERFGITEGITVNGECYTSIKQEDWEVFKETERRGFFQLRNKKHLHTISKVTIMKATQGFYDAIQKYLESEAEKDELFKAQWEKSGKNTQQVCNYIMSEVSKSRRCGWADEEIFGMAKHFIDEDELKDPGEANRVHRIVVNNQMDLSTEDKQKAMEIAKVEYKAQLMREEAERRAKQKEAEEKKKQAKAEKAKQRAAQEQSLFGGDLFGGI